MALARIRLFSQALHQCITCDVILPQRKNAASGYQLPVLWLLHGEGGNHGDWIRYTNIERYAAPYGLAVVMPSGGHSAFTDMAHGGAYATLLTDELPRTFHALFNFSNKRQDQFIAGFSTGGMASLTIGFNQPEFFSVIGCIGAGGLRQDDSILGKRRFELAFGTNAEVMNISRVATHILEEKRPCPRIFHACSSEDNELEKAYEMRAFFESVSNNPFDYHYQENLGGHDWYFADAAIQQFIAYLNLPKAENEYI